MAPRLNQWTARRRLPNFLGALFSPEQQPAYPQEIPPYEVVLKKARELAPTDDDPDLTAAVARAQAHQMAAQFIRTARQAANLSTQELARELGVSPAYLSDAQSFRSMRKVPLDLLIRVAHACNYGTVILAYGSKPDVKERRRAIANFEARLKQRRQARPISA